MTRTIQPMSSWPLQGTLVISYGSMPLLWPLWPRLRHRNILQFFEASKDCGRIIKRASLIVNKHNLMAGLVDRGVEPKKHSDPPGSPSHRVGILHLGRFGSWKVPACLELCTFDFDFYF